MGRHHSARLIAILLAFALFAALPAPASGDEGDEDSVVFINRFGLPQCCNAYGIGDTITEVRPGDTFIWGTHSQLSCYCGGWDSQLEITFPNTVEFDWEDHQSHFGTDEATFDGTTLTWNYEDFGGIDAYPRMKVKPLAQLPSGVNEIVMKAKIVVHNSDGDTFQNTTEDRLPLRLPVSIAKTATTAEAGFVEEGEEVTWNITASVDDPHSMKVTDTLPPASAGSVVPGSITPAPKSASSTTIVWNFGTFIGTRTMSYRFKVRDELDDSVEKVTNKVVGVTEGMDVATDAETLLVARPHEVIGQVRDISFSWPKSARIELSSPVPGATVKLIDRTDDSLVDTTEANGEGKFVLHTEEPGFFVVEATTRGDRFQTGDTEIQKNSVDVKGKQRVDVPLDNTEPVKTKVWAPKTFVGQVAKQLHKMNNLDLTYPFFDTFSLTEMSTQFGDRFPVLRDLKDAFQYDTTGIETTVNKALALDYQGVDGYKGEFKGVYRGDVINERDGWNALMRASMFMSMLEKRYAEATKMADVFAKAIAVAVAAEFARKLSAKLDQRWANKLGVAPRDLPRPTEAQRIAKAGKIGTMAFGIGSLLPAALDLSGYEGADKASIMEITAKTTRYAIDLLAWIWLKRDIIVDLGFEAVFNTLRIGIMAGYLQYYLGKSQSDVDAVGEETFEGRYYGDTYDAMKILDEQDERTTNRTRNLLAALGGIAQVTSFQRGVDGVLFTMGPLFKPAAGDASYFKKKYVESRTALIGLNSSLNNVSSNPKWFSAAAFTTMAGLVVDELVVRFTDIIKIRTAALLAENLDHKTATVADTRRKKKRAASIADTGPSAEYTAWSDELDAMIALVEAKDSAAAADAVETLIAADEALSARLGGIAEAALSDLLVTSGDAAKPLRKFIDARTAYEATDASALQALYVWRAKPAGFTKTAFLDAVAQLRPNTERADKLSAAAEAASAGITSPARLSLEQLDEIEDAVLLAGSEFEVVLRVKNQGDTTSQAATVNVEALNDIAVVSGASQTVPILAPGTWSDITVRFAPSNVTPDGYMGAAQALIAGDTNASLDLSFNAFPLPPD